MKDLINKQFEGFSIRIVQDDNDKYWFALKDVAAALEYPKSSLGQMNNLSSSIYEDWKGHKPIMTLGGKQNVTCVSQEGLFQFINRSDKPKAIPFQLWVNGEVLPEIMNNGKYEIEHAKKEPSAENDIKALSAAAEMLNVSESGKLKMVRTYAEEYAPNIVKSLPSYSIDAPSSSVLVAGKESAFVTFSATDLLKDKGYSIGARKFNILAEQKGFIERKKKGSKTFPMITKKGLEFGKNLVSDKDARIVQPHWFEDKFDELMEILLD